jgi:hypothetical protein
MPAKAEDRVHALARQANAHRGLTFTDSNGNNLDELYPNCHDADNNSDYDPSKSSDASSTSSTKSSDDSSSDDPSAADSDESYTSINPDPMADPPSGIAGVNIPNPGVANNNNNSIDYEVRYTT